jgi:hypothetical protein
MFAVTTIIATASRAKRAAKKNLGLGWALK